jgi:hypothetical protein
MAYTQAQVDAFWQRYVTMKQVDVISVSNAEPDFAGMLSFCYMNRLYGFADYGGSCAFPNNGNNKYVGGPGGR